VINLTIQIRRSIVKPTGIENYSVGLPTRRIEEKRNSNRSMKCDKLGIKSLVPAWVHIIIWWQSQWVCVSKRHPNTGQNDDEVRQATQMQHAESRHKWNTRERSNIRGSGRTKSPHAFPTRSHTFHIATAYQNYGNESFVQHSIWDNFINLRSHKHIFLRKRASFLDIKTIKVIVYFLDFTL